MARAKTKVKRVTSKAKRVISKAKRAKSKANPKRRRAHPRRSDALAALVETVFRLRAPGGCPWDRAQTHQTLRPYLIEEAYELLDVIDRIAKDSDLKRDPELRADFREELGDVLLQVVLHAEMAAQAGAFDIFDVAEALNEKLVRRHPHVFAKTKGKSADQALAHWEQEKAKEKAAKKARAESTDTSVLSGIPSQLPALQRAARVIEKVTKVGFQWPNLDGPLEKIEEEMRELRAEIRSFERDPTEARRARIEAELGDLLFCAANLGFLLKVPPEDALRGNLARFERRFRHVERRLAEAGRRPGEASLEEMDRHWREAKEMEKR